MAASASSAVHSLLVVGLDSARITGRGSFAAIWRRISSSNSPRLAVKPISTVALALRSTSLRSMRPGAASVQPATAARGLRERLLLVLELGVVLEQQPLHVDREDAAADLVLGQPLLAQDRADRVRDAGARLPHADDDEALLARSVLFLIRIAVSSAAQAVAPVPWMSSLNERHAVAVALRAA